MANLVSTGNTSTLAFAVWTVGSYTPEILSITPPGYTLDEIDDSHLGTTGVKRKVPVQLQEIGDLVVELRFRGRFTDEIADLMVSGAHPDPVIGTLTLTFPEGESGDATKPVAAGTAFIKGFEPGPLNNDDSRTATVTFGFDGATPFTYVVGAEL